ncbi:MAG TPA: SDR family oxidoreductase [Gammaproteobacteria bacterium]|nr:SDR family oxidoreductase [Gammaproteobacteria bacterium]
MRSALVTGGSRGIGLAIVDRFKAAGWRVATCARALDHLSESRADFRFACDVADAGKVRAGVASVAREFGAIDALVNNAVLGFTRAFADHAAARGVTVNAVCPGWVRTDMARERWKELGIDEAKAGSGVPLGRVVEPAEVASLVFFLASDEAGAITGQAFNIDGGMLA